MFVLERVIRGLCEEHLVLQSTYLEFLERIKELRKLGGSDYHEVNEDIFFYHDLM